MTDMKLAAVPVWSEADDMDVYRFGRDEVKWLNASECKLTREQIETMAKARFDSKQHHIKEFSWIDGLKWDDLDPDTMELERLDMIAAVKSVGFGVEGE